MNLPATVGGSDTAFVGFGGGTDGRTSTQAITSWTYSSGGQTLIDHSGGFASNGDLTATGVATFNGAAVDVTTDPVVTTTYLVGAPQLEFTYSGTGNNPFVYAQLVDDASGLVIGNQVTPIPVKLDGEEHMASLPLEMIAQTLAPGQTVTLQIVSSAVTYQPLKGGGAVTIRNIKLTLPTADPTKITISGPV